MLQVGVEAQLNLPCAMSSGEEVVAGCGDDREREEEDQAELSVL